MMSSGGCQTKLLLWIRRVVSVGLLISVSSRAEDRRPDLSCTGEQVATSAVPSEQDSGPRGSPPQPRSNARAHGIRLTWNASKSPVAIVTGYNIFRRESGPKCDRAGNTCQQVNRKIISATSCVDYSALPGHTYIYQAQTVSPAGLRSVMSNEAKASLN